MEHIKSQNEGLYTPDEAHEESDINVRAIFSFGIFLIVLAVVIHVGLWFFYQGLNKWYERKNAAGNPMQEQTLAQQGTQDTKGTRIPGQFTAEATQDATKRLVATFPEPRLQPDEYRDYEIYRKKVLDQANSYSWIDKNNGSVRIPITRAMEIIAQRGLPAAQPQSAQPARAAQPRQ
jgi:hypothetical protein